MPRKRVIQIPKKEDVLGKVYSHLEVISDVPRAGRASRYVLCKCKCGNQKEFRLQDLKTGNTKSCGCLKGAMITKKKSIHGGTGTRLHNIWREIKRRLYNPNDIAYTYYGAKGLEMEQEWINDFAKFREWAIQNGYSDTLTIDRIDNEVGYFPSNCRWVEFKEQANNKTNNHFLVINGEKKTVAQWAELKGLSPKTIYSRKYYGYSDEQAILSQAEFKKIIKRGKTNDNPNH